MPPLADAGKFWYYLLVALLLDTSYTAVNVPYSALTPELSHDYDERTTLNTFRFSFSILGGVIALLVHDTILNSFPGPFTGYAVSAAIWAVLIFGSNAFTFAFTKERHFREDRPEGPGFIEGVKIALRNRAFIYVTVIYLMCWLCIQFVQTNLLLYVKYWIGREDIFVYLALAVQLSSFVFLVVWGRVSRRIGKKQLYYIGMTFWIAVEVALFFVQPGQINILYVLAVLAGVGVSIGYLIPWSMLPDVIELDELETGQRREGIYYGFFVFLQKLGISLGIALSTAILGATGYINQVPGGPLPVQPPAVLLALRVFVSLVPAAILLASFVVVHLYPITREKHEAMRAQLQERRLAQAAGD